jgi:AAA domain
LHGVADRRRWSTRDLIGVEFDIVDQVAAGRDAGIGTVTRRELRRTIAAHPTISDEQAAMVETLTTGGHRIDAVVGVAGSGKTFALGVANELWSARGYTTVGLAFSGKAARGLEQGSSISSVTIDKFLHEVARPDHGGLRERTVVVIDEAGLVPTRKLAALLGHMRPDTKIVLVGDHHQLPEIGAGGVLRGIVDRFDDIAMLSENRRQHDTSERVALGELRDGDVAVGLDWYVHAGRVTASADMNDARRELVNAWWADHVAGRDDQLMMAERLVDVERLNTLARELCATHGRLSNERLDIGSRDYAVGDQVMFANNDYRLGVRNGERGTVTALDRSERTVTVHVADHDDGDVVVPFKYLADGDLVWGYAATVHKNQGATSDYSYLLASDALYRELGYVALSRGRIDNRIWTVTDIESDRDIEQPHGADHPERRDPIGELVRAMERSAAQQLAIDEASELDNPTIFEDVDIDVAELIVRRDAIGTALFRKAPLRVQDELDDATRRLAIAERRLNEASDHEWSLRSESASEARAQLDQYAAMQARFDDWTIAHQPDLVERRTLDTRIQQLMMTEVVAIEHDPPDHLVAAIGHPPVGVDARQQWRQAAVNVALESARTQPDIGPHGRARQPDQEMELA